jgi:hypothetical protein
MVNLTKNGAVVNIQDFSTRITLDYEYYSEPIFLADVGEFEFDLQNFSILLDL